MNISRSSELNCDEFYRYQMPTPKVVNQGSGNGVETYINNLDDIAQSLKRPSIYIIKYIGNTLGTNMRKDKHTNKYIINGRYASTQIIECIQKFIDVYVLCTTCGLPETDLKIKQRKEKVSKICNSCGSKEDIVIDKTGNFIIKNNIKQSSTVIL